MASELQLTRQDRGPSKGDPDGSQELSDSSLMPVRTKPTSELIIPHQGLALSARTVDLRCLRTISREVLSGKEKSPLRDHFSVEISEFRQIIIISMQQGMRFAREGHHYNRESVPTLIDLFTRDSAEIVVLEAGRVSAGRDPDTKMVGCFLLFTDAKNDAPDRDKIPWEWVKRELWDSGRFPEGRLGRASRAFVTDEARALGPHGKALDLMMNEVERITGKDLPLITRIVMGPPELAYRWSSAAFQARGFQNINVPLDVPDTVRTRSGGTRNVTLNYSWFMYPPLGDAGIQSLRSFQKEYRDLRVYEQRRIAFATANFSAVDGRIAVLGLNAPTDAPALARMFPHFSVLSVVPSSMMGPARKNYEPNLRMLEGGEYGDLALPGLKGVFLDGAIADVGRKGIDALLTNIGDQLGVGGIVVVRDWVRGNGPAEATLLLSTRDGIESKEHQDRSTAEKFDAFVAAKGRLGVSISPLEMPAPLGFRGVLVPYAVGIEFQLKKDYVDRWDVELPRAYPEFSHGELVRHFESRGFRVMHSGPEWNSWILENRIHDHAVMLDELGYRLPDPPTSFNLVAEKVAPGMGVRFNLLSMENITGPGFLQVCRFEDTRNQRVHEQVRRPGQTIDVVPWFEADGELFVGGKFGFPRPIVTLKDGGPPLIPVSTSGYIPEQYAKIVDIGSELAGRFARGEVAEADRESLSQLDRATAEVLHERAGISPDRIVSMGKVTASFASPGLLNELLLERLVEVAPENSQAVRAPMYSKFSTSGVNRFMESRQLLRACISGGVPVGRFERELYELHLSRGKHPGVWIGPNLALSEQEIEVPIQPETDLKHTPDRAVFRRLSGDDLEFFDRRVATFAEHDSAGRTVASAALECVTLSPKSGLSNNLAVVLPVIRTPRGILVGLERDTRDSPAAQEVTGSSALVAAPEFHIPLGISSLAGATSFLTDRMSREFDLGIVNWVPLGPGYFSTPGVTPETVYLMAAEVSAERAAKSSLKWFRLEDVISNASHLLHGHTAIAAYRTAHASGLLTRDFVGIE